MSRAFVNEDRGVEQLPVAARAVIPAGSPNWVTPRGLRLLQQEHEIITNEVREEADPAQQAAWRQRQAELEYRIASAQVINLSARPPEEVRFGAIVELARGQTQEPWEVTLVGADEADPSQNLLSIHSPLARALLGKRPGQFTMLMTDERKEVAMKIRSVRYASD